MKHLGKAFSQNGSLKFKGQAALLLQGFSQTILFGLETIKI